MRQLFNRPNKSLIALVAGSKANEDGGSTAHLTVFYVHAQPVLLILSHRLCDDNIKGIRAGAVLNKRTATADGGYYAVRKKRGLPADDVILSTRDMEVISLLVARLSSFLNYGCTRAFFVNLA